MLIHPPILTLTLRVKIEKIVNKIISLYNIIVRKGRNNMELVKLTEPVGKNEKVVTSGKWHFNWQDAKAMLYGFAKYYSIPILYLLEEVRRGATWEELKHAVYTIAMMQAISFFTKLRDEQKYVVEK